ncbi:MAG: 6-pyruvoyl-tetrahydropterin synthase-related protein [Cyanobacteria bacterium]|nr:6-pyruvoyl-tetrahydropterin synthase-related protein [Cyanobacteriota bacterium]
MVKELQRNDWINNFPIRFSFELAHGFGYPLYLFYAPLVYYLGALLMIFVKLSHIVATKWLFAFTLIIGPFIFYWSVRQKLDKKSALLATILYSAFPFRGNDIYIRGGVGETWAMALLPGVFGSIFLIEKNNRFGFLLFSIFLGLTIFSHNLTAFLITPFIVLYGLIFCRKKHFWLGLFLGIGLSALFWLPAIYYLPIVKVTYSNMNTGQLLNFLDSYKDLFKLEYPANPEARYSGFFTYLLIFFWLIYYFSSKRKKKLFHREILFWLLSGSVIYLSLTSIFYIFWKITISFTRILQFPWRLLIVLSFILPFCTGLIFNIINKKSIKLILLLIIVIISFYFLSAFRPMKYSYFYEYSADDTGVCATSWGDEYLPVWVKECAGAKASNIIEVDKGKANVLINKPNEIEADIEVTGKQAKLTIFKYYFPGWRLSVDGKEVNINYRNSKQGLISTIIKKGNHHIKVFYTKTKVMWIADVISLISLSVFLYLLFKLIKAGSKFITIKQDNV